MKNGNEILKSLSNFKGKHGLYIIMPKSNLLLQEICNKLNYDYKSDVAYIGKGGKTNKSDLFCRGKQEMGWSNFEGATFVRKIGLYLEFDIKDKKNKELKEKTKEFICKNFTIQCVEFPSNTSLLEKETEYILHYKPCLNDKKNKRINL